MVDEALNAVVVLEFLAEARPALDAAEDGLKAKICWKERDNQFLNAPRLPQALADDFPHVVAREIPQKERRMDG